MRGHPTVAAFYNRVLSGSERGFLGQARLHLLQNLAGRVLDLGAGTGANLPYFSADVEVVALEPDPFMRRQGENHRSAAPVRWVASVAEDMPFSAGYFDAVVATLVLCTVADPGQALSEIYRVLRPGGLFVFLEHVASPAIFMRHLQSAVNPVWRLVTAGCNLNRDTIDAIKASGFELVWQKDRPFALLPIVWGAARKREVGEL